MELWLLITRPLQCWRGFASSMVVNLSEHLLWLEELEQFVIAIFDKRKVLGNRYHICAINYPPSKFHITINIYNKYVRCFFSIAALDCAKVTAENSEFLRIPPKLNDRGNICNEEQTISATNSDVTVTGCYVHHSVAEEENTLSNPAHMEGNANFYYS